MKKFALIGLLVILGGCATYVPTSNPSYSVTSEEPSDQGVYYSPGYYSWAPNGYWGGGYWRGRGVVRGATRAAVYRNNNYGNFNRGNVNVNRNVNMNRNVNRVNVNRNVNRGNINRGVNRGGGGRRR